MRRDGESECQVWIVVSGKSDLVSQKLIHSRYVDKPRKQTREQSQVTFDGVDTRGVRFRRWMIREQRNLRLLTAYKKQGIVDFLHSHHFSGPLFAGFNTELARNSKIGISRGPTISIFMGKKRSILFWYFCDGYALLIINILRGRGSISLPTFCCITTSKFRFYDPQEAEFCILTGYAPDIRTFTWDILLELCSSIKVRDL